MLRMRAYLCIADGVRALLRQSFYAGQLMLQCGHHTVRCAAVAVRVHASAGGRIVSNMPYITV